MEVEGRTVGICLVGVAHDQVEREIEDTMRQSAIPGEVVFWESDYRRPYAAEYPKYVSTGHWGLEDNFFSQMSFVYSMLVTLELEIETETMLGHGYFLEKYYNQFLKGYREGIKYYDKLTTDHKIIFCLSTSFFEYVRKILIEQGVEYTVTRMLEYFNYNESVVIRFLGSITRCLTQLTFNKEGKLNMTKHTVVNILIFFLWDFRGVLGTYKDHLPTELQEVVRLLIE